MRKSDPTVCRNGHLRTPQNTRINGNGTLVCKECRRIQAAARYARDFKADEKVSHEHPR